MPSVENVWHIASKAFIPAMRSAANRDMVARQYVEGFRHVLEFAAPWIAEGLNRGWTMPAAIVHAQMRLLAEFPDSLIGRKCGPEVARRSAAMAAPSVAASGHDACRRDIRPPPQFRRVVMTEQSEEERRLAREKRREERRRFELLLAHWDVPVVRATLEP